MNTVEFVTDPDALRAIKAARNKRSDTRSHRPIRARVRPYRAYYYRTTRDAESAWYRMGHACTLIGAIRAAVTKVHLGEAWYVSIYDAFSKRVAYVKTNGKSVRVVCV